MENLQAFVSDPFFAEDDKQMIIYFSSEETAEQGNTSNIVLAADEKTINIRCLIISNCP
jgi:hypothetical protein